MTRRRAVALLVLALVAAASGCTDRGGAPPGGITVAAASDLRGAFEELGTVFTDETGIPVTFSFGSSGQLREQIVNGAPFDVFASADDTYVDDVVEAGRGVAGTRSSYGAGRLALVARAGARSPQRVSELSDPAYERIAIANPVHAPYGRAALEALTSAGIVDEVDGRLLYGENVADTLRLVRSGNADVGIVALSLVLGGDARVEETPVLVPDELHQPLRQALVVTAAGEDVAPATAFAALTTSPRGRALLLRYGFALPGERLPIDDG